MSRLACVDTYTTALDSRKNHDDNREIRDMHGGTIVAV